MKSICLIICLLFFLGCTGTSVGTDPGLPHGYKLMCSAEGKYTLFIPEKSEEGKEGSDIPGIIAPSVWDIALEAKEFAWYYERTRTESDKYQWHECE